MTSTAAARPDKIITTSNETTATEKQNLAIFQLISGYRRLAPNSENRFRPRSGWPKGSCQSRRAGKNILSLSREFKLFLKTRRRAGKQSVLDLKAGQLSGGGVEHAGSIMG
jgi:hypothetical protein